MKKETIQELLLRSFDQEISGEERTRLNAALADSEELRREKRQLEALRQWMGSLQATPVDGFVDGVMNQLSEAPVTATLLSFLPRAAAACFIILLLSLAGIYLAEGSLSADTIIGVSNLAPEDAFTYLEY